MKKNNLIYQVNKKTFLITENEDISFYYLTKIIKNEKITIVKCNDGYNTIEFCKTNQEIDLVLMDVNMPNINNIVATKLIKELRPNLPIIIQTSKSYDSIRDYKNIFDDFVLKPVNKNELLSKISKFI